MSYAPSNNSWYASKKNVVPAHPAAAPAPPLYNIGHAANSTQQQPPPVWNGVQQPYWQNNPTNTAAAPRPPSANQGIIHTGGDNSWNWGSQPTYQPQQQVNHHQQQQQQISSLHQQQQTHYEQPGSAAYHNNFYGNANTQPVPSSNNDPWNWGIDDSFSTEGMNNNVDAVDPTWNWSVDGSSNYQHSTQPYEMQQPPVAYATSPPPTLMHGNTPSQGLTSDVQSTGTNYGSHEVIHQFHGHPDKTHSSTSFHNYSEENGTGHYENVNLQHQTNSSTQLQSVPSSNYFVSDSIKVSKENRSNIDESTNVHASVQSTFLHNTPVSTVTDSSIDGHVQKETVSSVVKEEVFSQPDVNEMYTHQTTEPLITGSHFTSGAGSASDVRPLGTFALRDDSRSEIKSEHSVGEPDSLVHSELSISSVMRHDRQVMAQDGLFTEHQELDYSVTSKRSSMGNDGLTPQWSTESLPSQGSDEMSHALEGGNRNDFMPSPLSTVSQSPLLTDTGNYDHNQFDSSSSYHNTPSPAGGKELMDNMAKSSISPSHDEQIPSEMQPMSSAALSAQVENVSQQMTRLQVAGSEAKQGDIGNKEIVPPETNAFHPPNKEPTPPLASGSIPPPPMHVPPPGPPKVMPNTSGNPYAGSKNSLTHKSSNKYRVTTLPSTESSDTSNHNSPMLPPMLKDSNILHPSEVPLPQALYGSNVVEPPAGIDRSRSSLTAEEEVNLETLPDNKERPDMVEILEQSSLDRKSISPMNAVRLNAPTIAQSAESNPRQWTQAAAYSTSPENQEVAPRCGPDRNQYLETGQLSDDEEESEVSQYRLRETNSWSGLQRMIPGQITEHDATANQTELQNSAGQHSNEDVSTPPPGLHRMIPGQTEQENLASQDVDGVSSQDAGSDVMLQRMVPGRMTNDNSNFNPNERTTMAGDENPPPGLRRMVPGESSSPESQGVGSSQTGSGSSFQPISAAPMVTRIVTGVSREEVDGTDGQTMLGPVAPSTNSRSPSPTPDQPAANKTQPTAERSETIGSDSVETYPPPPTDNTNRDISSSNRRENTNKDRDRRHREDEPIEDRDGRRRNNHSYREREREESPSGGRFEQEKRSHRSERDHNDRHGDGDGERRNGDRRDGDRRDRIDVDGYERKRRERERVDRPKSTRDRGRRDESPDSRRYREERIKDRKRYDTREGYGNYRPSQDEKRRYGRRHDYRDTDTGSEYNSDRDYDRREYDRRGYDRRDYDRHDKSGYRGRDEYGSRYRDNVDGRRHRDNRSHHDRSKFEGLDKSYRDRQDHRPESREREMATQFVPPLTGFHGLNGRSMTEYLTYYSNLRSYDSTAYTDWYNNVYKGIAYQQRTSYSEDRGSVHSGRSSVNSGLFRERYERSGVCNATDYYRRSPVSLGSSDLRLLRDMEHTTASLTEDQGSPQRLTPSKYATAHVKGIFTARGQLIKILPHYPLDGQPGIVEIYDMQELFAFTGIRRELKSYPGPLVKGVTHKNSLIAFCTSKIKSAECNTDLFDRESVILLWKLLILLLRQNGTVVGTDIAELLLSGSQSSTVTLQRPSASSTPASHYSRDDAQTEEPVISSNKTTFNLKSEEEVTNAFREFLLYGNTKEALEWAMENSLWGHALFLASKMDQRTYANVMMRFANGLTLNDPLQTLYQLMSGRQPAAVTCCADERWGDWKPHLAMILSNSSHRLELNHKSITTLGDTLGARGCLHAAHFTYLMAQVDFGTYAQKGAKVVLLGSSHQRSFEEFASNEAIQMTEIYEYACKLAEPEYTIRPLQWYKLIYAKRLAEQGLVSEAMQYTEELSQVVLAHPEHYSMSLIKETYELGDCLKYNDPFYNCGREDGAEQSELPWLVKLKQVISDINSGIVQEDVPNYGSVSNLSYTEGENSQHGTVSADYLPQIPEPVAYDYNWQQQQQQPQQNQQLQQQQYVPTYLDPQQEQWQDQQQQQQQQQDQQATVASEVSAFQQPQGSQSLLQPEWPSTPQSISQWDTQGNSTLINDNGMNQQQPYSSYWDQSAAHEELPAPQISLPNSMPERSQKKQSDSDMQSKPAAKSNQKKDVVKSSNAGNGWFGGLWNKLALRPKNQMKLPDDKNPTIVWDSDRKRWTNLDADGEEVTGDLPPPPKASAMMGNNIPNSVPMQAAQPAVPTHPSVDQTQPTTGMNKTNMYKMNRGRSIRSNYVDVLGGNKAASQSVPPPADIFPSIGNTPQNMNFFVPGPSEAGTETVSSDYITASTVSSGAQEVNSNHQDQSVQGSEPQQAAFGGPLMFNPSNYAQPIPYTANSNNQFKNRYPNK